ncbi:MAG: NUDIX domain-containing protein [Gammaproteobacteria bacterium]|nr:NUDIX domain-containing protein [Gammaproteobacteria bacterium]
MVTQMNTHQHVISDLQRYRIFHPDEADIVDDFLTLVKNTEQPFSRYQYQPGHIIAAGCVFSPDLQSVLLMFHQKIGTWVHPGGHPTEEDACLADTFARELREELGLVELQFVETNGLILPVNLGIHDFQAHGDQPTHQHFDCRYAVVIDPETSIVRNDESADARWFDIETLSGEGVVGEVCDLVVASQKTALRFKS